MFTERLINELGLLKLHVKSSDTTVDITPTENLSHIQDKKPVEPTSTVNNRNTEEVKLDKNEFRLLIKMLQAIGHECTYDHISLDGDAVKYQHPKTNLVFKSIDFPDTKDTMNLSSLKDILDDSSLKRAVWEKLKTLV